jgi:hypothetical protein
MSVGSKFQRQPTPSPNFNRGWRLGVAFGAAIIVLALVAAIGALVVGVIGVWVEQG